MRRANINGYNEDLHQEQLRRKKKLKSLNVTESQVEARFTHAQRVVDLLCTQLVIACGFGPHSDRSPGTRLQRNLVYLQRAGRNPERVFLDCVRRFKLYILVCGIRAFSTLSLVSLWFKLNIWSNLAQLSLAAGYVILFNCHSTQV